MVAVTNFASDFYVRVSAYTGTCESLVCASDQWGDQNSWDVVEGEVYYVAVHGENYASAGDFVIAIQQVEAGSVCLDVEDLGQLGAEGILKLGSTVNAGVFSSLPVCYDSVQSPAAVYSLLASATGTVSATVSSSNMDVRVSVYRGACDSWLECHGQHSYRSATFTASQDDS